ncbi:hypothetical protein [Catenulispora pinisilvae]|uniref:hypothetical protein n=1 Tax=Catenulispora pinisilvae TaxID=2705253 RepID=UPI001891F05A|nr:hypothetical protein [Catenulispora pinisilvae]
MSEPLFQSLEDAVVVSETALLDTQVAVESLRAELDQFTRLHQIQLGPLYGRLDELDALTAETEAAMTGDPEAIRRAVEARARVDGEDPLLFAAANAGLLEDDEEDAAQSETPPRPREEAAPAPDPDVPVRPSKTAQRLYRELARRSHPDLVQDPTEIARRSAFITRVNAAYEKDDLPGLQKLSEEWSLTSSGPGVDAPQREMWLRNRLIWLRAKQAELALERQTLMENPMADVLAAYQYDSLNALRSISEQLYTAIAEREALLNALIGS